MEEKFVKLFLFYSSTDVMDSGFLTTTVFILNITGFFFFPSYL